MSYGDEQAESRRLHSFLKEGEGSMTAPRTEAGRALWAAFIDPDPSWIDDGEQILRAILAIESEAAAINVNEWIEAARKERLAIEAEAAALTPGALDVDVLRLALNAHFAEGERTESLDARYHCEGSCTERIAAEYARLSAGQAEEE